MRFLYQRGTGARRRVMHLTGYDPRTGEPTMHAICGAHRAFDTTSNVPFGRPICKRCEEVAQTP